MSETSKPHSDPFSGEPGTPSSAGGSWGNSGGGENQHSEPDERPLHDYIDMEAYDVVAGERHRALVAQFERELVAARIDNARLEEQLEAAQKALWGNGHRPPGTPGFHMDGCSGCAALAGASFPARES